MISLVVHFWLGPGLTIVRTDHCPKRFVRPALISSLFQFDFVGRVTLMSLLALLICKRNTKFPILEE